MKRRQINADVKDDLGLSLGDKILTTAQLERNVDYAGPLAGHNSGAFKLADGSSVLVTTPARPVSPKRGDCDALENFIGELLGNQAVHFLYWLKVGYESLCKGDFRPGQCSIFAGPSECGKSFVQTVITHLFGGRVANPFQYMMGETTFNAQLAWSEHLMMEDPGTSFDVRSRRKFGSAIKEFTVNKEIAVHEKGRTAINLPTFRRVTISVNDEPENLMVVPPLDASMLDKVNLYKCVPAKLSSDRDKNMAMLKRELPALAHKLMRLTIPKAMHSPRYGVLAYHAPELLEILCEISEESRLLTIIDEVIFAAGVGQLDFWTGSAAALQSKLMENQKYAYTVAKILPYSSACGTYLARLAQKFPSRFKSTRGGGKTKWTIHPQLQES